MRLPLSGRTGKICHVVFHMGVVALLLLGLVWALPRGIGFIAALVLLFLQSPPPWWILAPATFGLIVGFPFLFKKTAGTWLPSSEDFVN